MTDEGKPVILTCLVRSPSFPSSVVFAYGSAAARCGSAARPLRYSRIDARLKKPSRLAFFLRLAPPREGFWSAASDEAMRRASVGFPWGKLSRSGTAASALGGKSQAVWLFLTLRAPPGGRLLVGRFPNGKALGMPLLFRNRRIDPYSSLPPEKEPLPSKKYKKTLPLRLWI